MLDPMVNTVRAIDAWDGYHWLVARQVAQDHDWVALKQYMDTMGETYLRETMEHVIECASPRLYQDYWTVCPTLEYKDDALAKMDVGS